MGGEKTLTSEKTQPTYHNDAKKSSSFSANAVQREGELCVRHREMKEKERTKRRRDATLSEI